MKHQYEYYVLCQTQGALERALSLGLNPNMLIEGSHLLSLNQNIEVMSVLLAAGADVNFSSKFGTALENLVNNFCHRIDNVFFDELHEPEAVEFLIKAGALDIKGSLVDVCVSQRKYKMAAFLMDRGFTPTVVSLGHLFLSDKSCVIAPRVAAHFTLAELEAVCAKYERRLDFIRQYVEPIMVQKRLNIETPDNLASRVYKV